MVNVNYSELVLSNVFEFSQHGIVDFLDNRFFTSTVQVSQQFYSVGKLINYVHVKIGYLRIVCSACTL